MKANNEKPDIIIADSQYLIVEALKNILEEQYIIKSTANSRSELFASLKHDPPKLLIIDPLLLDLDESDDLKEIMNLHPSMNIVVLINYK
jgi:DNA-binding NarL/FixJ family response regulator